MYNIVNDFLNIISDNCFNIVELEVSLFDIECELNTLFSLLLNDKGVLRNLIAG